MPQRRRPRQPMTDPGRDEKVSLKPLTAEQAFKALLATPPPREDENRQDGHKAKR